MLRDCDNMSLADIEKAIKDLAGKGRDGKLTVDELTGGNFTITNGGVFGSLMSTPSSTRPRAPFWVCTRSRTAPWPSTARSRSCR